MARIESQIASNVVVVAASMLNEPAPTSASRFQEQRRPDRFIPTTDPISRHAEAAAFRSDRGQIGTDTSWLKAMSDPFGRAHNLARSALPVSYL
jgi:hypothetical protein